MAVFFHTFSKSSKALGMKTVAMGTITTAIASPVRIPDSTKSQGRNPECQKGTPLAKDSSMPARAGRDVHPGCGCPQVILGKITPDMCPLFMKACTPERPKGACMVSKEGTCSIWAVGRPL